MEAQTKAKIFEIMRGVAITALIVCSTSVSLVREARADGLWDYVGTALGAGAGHNLCKGGTAQRALCSAAGAGIVNGIGGGNTEENLAVGAGAAVGEAVTKSGWGAAGGAAIAKKLDRDSQKRRSSQFEQSEVDGKTVFHIPVHALGNKAVVYVAQFDASKTTRGMSSAQQGYLAKEVDQLHLLITVQQHALLEQMNNGQPADVESATREVQGYTNRLMQKYAQMAEVQGVNTTYAGQRIVTMLQSGVTPINQVNYEGGSTLSMNNMGY